MRLGLIMTLLGVGAAFVAPIAGGSRDIRIKMGVQVKTLKPAPPGAPKPKAGDIVVAHYTGWLKQGLGKGDQFDSSRGGFGPFQKPPFTFALGRNRVINFLLELMDTLLVPALAEQFICRCREAA